MIQKILAICWPLWRESMMGAKANDQIELYLKASGQGYLESDKGLELMEQLLSDPKPPELVIVGKPERVKQFLKIDKEAPSVVQPLMSSSSDFLPDRRKKMKLIWKIC